MTTVRRDGGGSEFAEWVRNNPRLDSSIGGAALSVTDLDFIFHRYYVKDKRTGERLMRQHIMLLELKTFGATSPMAQADTLSFVDQAFRMAEDRSKRHFKAVRGWVCLHYHGLHVLRCSHGGPESSEWMEWDGKRITVIILEELFQFKRDAQTLEPREDRSHHKQTTPPLASDWVTV